MSIPFFSPIIPYRDPSVCENCSFLRFTTHFFDFGQKSYKITVCKENGFELMEEEREAPPLWQTAARIAALFTLIIPLLMLMGLAVYRALNSFESGPNRLNSLPKELYDDILKKSGFGSINLAATSHENKRRIQSDPWYERGCDALKGSIASAKTLYPERIQAEKVIREALEKTIKYGVERYKGLDIFAALEIVKSEGWRDQLSALAYLAKNIKDKKEAEMLIRFAEDPLGFNAHHHLQENLLRINTYRSATEPEISLYHDDASSLISFAAIIALSDVSKALEIIDAVRFKEEKEKVRINIIEVIAKFDPERAFEIANTLQEHYLKQEVFKFVAAGFALSDFPRALAIANTYPSKKLAAYKLIFSALARVEPERALEMANNLDRIYFETQQILACIVKAFTEYDSENALTLAKTITSVKIRGKAECAIAISLARSDPLKAALIANSIENGYYKSKALASIAFK